VFRSRNVEPAQRQNFRARNPIDSQAAAKFPLSRRRRFAHCFYSHLQTRFALVFVLSDPKSNVPGWRRQSVDRGAKKDRALMIIALAQAQLEMFFPDNAWSSDRFNFPRKKSGCGLPLPNG